ncbi:hypothetical protein DFJ73DRAFT_394874 [Zopfochytrium polystomum]|nr:hypothetical protein DFJ73DRAFT_394874 [Zopfochytrium polystomum]
MALVDDCPEKECDRHDRIPPDSDTLEAEEVDNKLVTAPPSGSTSIDDAAETAPSPSAGLFFGPLPPHCLFDRAMLGDDLTVAAGGWPGSGSKASEVAEACELSISTEDLAEGASTLAPSERRRVFWRVETILAGTRLIIFFPVSPDRLRRLSRMVLENKRTRRIQLQQVSQGGSGLWVVRSTVRGPASATEAGNGRGQGC